LQVSGFYRCSVFDVQCSFILNDGSMVGNIEHRTLNAEH
jgi:hypothetical protein